MKFNAFLMIKLCISRQLYITLNDEDSTKFIQQSAIRIMDDKLRESRKDKRSDSSLSTSSFKMAESMLLGSGNKKVLNLNVANVRFIDKSSYKKQEKCQICFITFSTLTRQHHCRICANAVCSSCSVSSINKQRACDVCALKYSEPNKELTKTKILQQLKGIATLYVQNKQTIDQELKALNQKNDNSSTLQQLQKSSDQKLEAMNKQIENLKNERIAIEEKIKEIQGN